MRVAALILLAALGCTAPKKGCVSGLEIGVNGSKSEGTQSAGPEVWDTDDVTIGGHATLYLDFTGACEDAAQ